MRSEVRQWVSRVVLRQTTMKRTLKRIWTFMNEYIQARGITERPLSVLMDKINLSQTIFVKICSL